MSLAEKLSILIPILDKCVYNYLLDVILFLYKTMLNIFSIIILYIITEIIFFLM